MGPSYRPSSITHFFTVDVEDYFQAAALERQIPRDAWPSFSGRVDHAVDRLLALLGDARATATFFTLGWIAERSPALVRRIAREGHEIGSRGMWDRAPRTLGISAFRDEVRRSKATLEDAAGVRVIGYRAPGASLPPGMEWAFDVLAEEGYEYDSSRVPSRGARGLARTPRYAHAVPTTAGAIIEVPLTALDVAGARLPAMGGGWLRHAPYAAVRATFTESSRSGVPGVLCVRPWELDPEQPRLAGGAWTRWRQYGGLKRTEPRLGRLLREFRFRAIADGLGEVAAGAPLLYA